MPKMGERAQTYAMFIAQDALSTRCGEVVDACTYELVQGDSI
jgi:hypothetical protein